MTASPATVRPIYNARYAPRRAFSLLEMMLVMVIIGLLSTVVIISIGGTGDKAKIKTSKFKMRQIVDQIEAYQLEQNAIPTSLKAFTEGPTPTIKKQVLADGWNNEFFYSPRPNASGQAYTLLSMGKDGIRGTDDDIDAWTMDDVPATTP